MALILTAKANPGEATWGSQQFSHGVVAAGTAQITEGGSSVTIVGLGGEGVDPGSPTVALLNTVPSEGQFVQSAVWEGNDLVISLDTALGEDDSVTLSYAVFAPLV